MSAFKLTSDALDDMRDIARYTEHQWGRDQRNKYLTNLNQCFERLAENPTGEATLRYWVYCIETWM